MAVLIVNHLSVPSEEENFRLVGKIIFPGLVSVCRSSVPGVNDSSLLTPVNPRTIASTSFYPTLKHEETARVVLPTP